LLLHIYLLKADNKLKYLLIGTLKNIYVYISYPCCLACCLWGFSDSARAALCLRLLVPHI